MVEHFEDSKEAQEKKNLAQKTCATSAMKPLISIFSFSKWLKLVCKVAWILCFAEHIRCKEAGCQSGELEPQKLKTAERIIMCLEQEECFPDELKALRNSHGVSSRSSVKSLNPVLDTGGLLSVNGISEDARNRILLTEKHHITRLIIVYHHEFKNLEAGVNYVLAGIRTHFWIVYGREAVRSW